MQALILADGDVASRDRIDASWPGWLGDDVVVIAADGGARHAVGLGVAIDRWVGDGDSLGEAGIGELEAAGVRVERHPVEKDASDTELALEAATAAGADTITIVGALGGARIDHGLANLGLLSLPGLAARDVRLVAADARVRLLTAPRPDGTPAWASLTGHVGDLVTLLPVGADAEGVTIEGLRFALHDEPLLLGRTRGLSNVRDVATASVRLRRGRLLIVETPATL
jgi:thiamine pyrophosphokinase